MRGQSDPELKKYLWVVIRTQKDRKLQTLIEVCTDFSSLVAPSHPHRITDQTFAVHQEAESYMGDEGQLEDVFAVGDRPPGTIGDRRNPRTRRHCIRCSHWHDGWGTICGLSPDRWTATDQTRTTLICGQFGHMRTCHYRLNLRAGSFSPTLNNNGMVTIDRETPHRPGPHPHRSVFTSSKPHAIVTHLFTFTSFTTGYFDQCDSTTSELIHRGLRVNHTS